MSTKKQILVSGLFIVIILIGLITLILPTKLVILMDNDVLRGQPYVITVSTLTHHHTFSLPTSDSELTAIEVGGFSAMAFIQYPKYFIGLLATMALALIGYFTVNLNKRDVNHEQV